MPRRNGNEGSIDEEYAEGRRKKKQRRHEEEPQGRTATAVLRIIRLVVWGFATLLLLIFGLGGLGMIAYANGAVQEAAGAAVTAAGLVGIYALARAISAITHEVESMLRGQNR
jgi:hypothetical protein